VGISFGNGGYVMADILRIQRDCSGGSEGLTRCCYISPFPSERSEVMVCRSSGSRGDGYSQLQLESNRAYPFLLRYLSRAIMYTVEA
jgi:hypothetical protein